GLADDRIGRLTVNLWRGEPDQHTIVVGIGNDDDIAVSRYGVGAAQTGGCERGVVGDEIGLSEDEARITAAGAANSAGNTGILRGPRVSRDIAEAQDAVVIRGGSETIGVH